MLHFIGNLHHYQLNLFEKFIFDTFFYKQKGVKPTNINVEYKFLLLHNLLDLSESKIAHHFVLNKTAQLIFATKSSNKYLTSYFGINKTSLEMVVVLSCALICHLVD